jgi:hypothetical protein
LGKAERGRASAVGGRQSLGVGIFNAVEVNRCLITPA